MSETGKGRVAPTGMAPQGAMQKPHTLTLTARTDAQITGVLEVLSFDDCTVALKTGVGDLLLEGTGLRVHELDVEGGRLAVSGEISALYYSTRQEGERRARRSRSR